MKKIFIAFLSLGLFIGFKINGYGFGFKKNNNHVQPDIGYYQSELNNTNSYYCGSNDSKDIYLTFDAGYDNGNLEIILDTLKQKNIKSTFFVTGDFCNRESELLKRIVDDGHLVGNHTFNHKNITKLSEYEIEEEVAKLENKYQEVTGKTMPKFFRPPEGEFDKRSLTTISNLGYKTFFWSIAYNDWNTNKQKGPDYGYNMVVNNLHNGAIILLHTVSSDNAQCLSKIIDKAITDGYTFKNLDEFK